MPLPITYKLTCPKCGYSMTKIVGDAEIYEVLYTNCPECGSIMKKEKLGRSDSLNFMSSITDKLFKK